MTAEKSVDKCLRNVNSGRPATKSVAAVRDFLRHGADRFEPVVEGYGESIVLDLSAGSRLCGEALQGIGVDRFSRLVNRQMRDAGAGIAYGRYAEPRDLYHSEIFANAEASQAERRDVHLGIDVFCEFGSPILTPLDGVIEIVANNTAELDYGPMLVLRHATDDGTPFYLLHGHLALDSVKTHRVGDRFAAGEKIAEVGWPPENGNWPPHLHLQVIVDLLGLGADFPGVAYLSQLKMWLELSPSPATFFPDRDAAELNHPLGNPA